MSMSSFRPRSAPVAGRRPRLGLEVLESRDVPTTQLYATGPGPGGPPLVIVHNAANQVVAQFMAFDPRFTGGVSVATGDVNGDGVSDVIVGAGPGGGPHVRAINGATLLAGQVVDLFSFMAYDPRFTGGVNVAAGDVNGDGRADIITGAGPGGGPHVK
ncbi:MAG TPA: VCBS repeat-containing protein, partial [Gemmataceae bacterium]